jgi:hypothetical protein
MNHALRSSTKCKAAALFMHDLSPAASTLIFLLLLLSIPFLCLSMGTIAQDHPQPHPYLAQKRTFPSPSPPPNRTPNHASPSPNPVTPLPPLSPTGAFALGSTLFLLICIALFILALSIQRFAYCPQNYNAAFGIEIVFFWVLLAGECLAGCYAAGCWVVLLRDLIWGERGPEVLPMGKEGVVVRVLMVVVVPVVLVGSVGRELWRACRRGV